MFSSPIFSYKVDENDQLVIYVYPDDFVDGFLDIHLVQQLSVSSEVLY